MTPAVVDTSAIVALHDESYDEHATLAREVTEGDWELVVSPFVVAEADYMLSTRLGPEAARRFSRDVVRGAYRLAAWGVDDHARAVTVCESYGPAYIGIADAANVVLAARLGTATVFTLDQRHFRVLTPLTAVESFTLLPYDI